MTIDGKKIAADILGRLSKQHKPEKFLAAVLVGEDSASESFLKQKAKAAEAVGVDFQIRRFPAGISKKDLLAEIGSLNNDPTCGGIIVQLPLPDRSDEQEILDAIPAAKDVDVLGREALARFAAGESEVMPPPIGTVIECLSAAFGNPMAVFQAIISATIAVVGAGRLVGQPIAAWLNGKAKEVIVLDKGDDLSRLKEADIVVLGAGVPGLVKPEMLKEGSIVIDFGYGKLDEKVSGDLDLSSLQPPTSSLLAYTPTPGGTGPILVAKLLENFFKLNP